MKTLVFWIPIVLILLSGCNNKPTSSDEHDHEGEASFKYTAYSDDIELFAEAEPLVTGDASGILAHFTWLDTFRPVHEGKVTLSLIVGTKGISQSIESPERPGIYHFNIKPGTSGKGRLVFDIENNTGKFSITIPDIEVFADDHEAIEAAEEAEISNPNATVFTKEQSWKIDFATANPVEKPFGTIIKTTALVEPAQGDRVVITAKTSGIVLFEDNVIVEGSGVLKDKTLFTISGKNMADNNMLVRFNEAKTRFEKASKNYERISALAEDKIVSQKEFLDSKSEYENAKIAFENLNSNFNENGQAVSCPVNGFIEHMHVTQGEFVEAGQPVLVIAQNKQYFLQAEVQQRFAEQLNHLVAANIKPGSGKEYYSLKELNGKIVSLGKNISDENFLIPVTLQVENIPDIFSGSIVDVNLICRSELPKITIPNSALIEEQGNYFVFVQLTPELFEKREIRIGMTDGISTEIMDGISVDDRIVTRGGIIVKLAAVSNSLDPHAGHVH